MYVVSSLVAHPQPAGLVQPCQGSLDNPPVHAQPAAMPGAPLGDHRRDVALTQRLAVLLGIVGPVRIQPSGLRRGRPRLPRTGGTASTSGSNWVTSWRLAPVRIAARGVPLASVIT